MSSPLVTARLLITIAYFIIYISDSMENLPGHSCKFILSEEFWYYFLKFHLPFHFLHLL